MHKFLAGVLAGMIIATYAPNVAGLARDFFDAGRNLGGEIAETVGEVAER